MSSDVAVVAARAKAHWRRPFEFWLNGVERGWAIPALLIGFVATWMAFLVIAYQGGDLHPDVLETWSVGREFAWGNPKHPPLMGWMAALWSRVFPLTDWSFYLLAMVNSAFALWMVDLTSRRFVRGDGRAVILLLLLLLPAYQFHAQRFNANTALLATWPLAIYCFLRSFETRAFVWAVAAGATAALAMLGKYYSVFLIAGFAASAIAHPQRRVYFRSAAPWVSGLTGLAVLAPHLWWLASTGSAPFGYAIAAHGGLSTEVAIREAGMFLVGIAAYLALPAFAWVLMIRSNLGRFVSDVTRLDPGLLLLFWIFVATTVFPPMVSIALQTDLPPIWNLQALFLVVVVSVAAVKFAIDRFDSVNLSTAVSMFLLGCVVAAPFHALYRNTHPFDLNRNFLSAAAQEMTRRWHQETGEPFTAISGDDSLAFAAAFYSPDHPVYRRPFQFQYTWGLPRPATLEKGWAAMCFSDDATCLNWMRRVAEIPARVIRSEFTLQASLWGRPGVTTKISAMIVPPVDMQPAEPASIRDGEMIEDFGASRRLRYRPTNVPY
jgi:hypothetical protein